MYEESQKVAFRDGSGDAATGGLHFKAVDENELQPSREAYLREQEAWETGSQSTAVTGDTPMYRGPQQDYFEAAKSNYLANGPSGMVMGGANGSRPGTPGSYELTRVNTNATSDLLIPSAGKPGESRENLLYGGTATPGTNYAGRGAGSPGAFLPPLPHPASNGSYGQVSNPAPYESYEDVDMGYYGYDNRRFSNPALSNNALPPGAAPPIPSQGGLNGTPAPAYPSTFAYPPSRSNNSSPSQQYPARYSPPMYRGQASTPAQHQQQSSYSQQDYGHRQNPSNSSNLSLGRFNNGGYGGR